METKVPKPMAQSKRQEYNFFHNISKIRRIQNKIDNIKDNEGKEVRGQEEVNKEAFRYYKKLLSFSSTNSEYEEFLQHTPKKSAMEKTMNLKNKSKKRKWLLSFGIYIWIRPQTRMGSLSPYIKITRVSSKKI